ncbi:hypothetical protein EPK99_23650 [Neorhizobium lilium]|uniref:Uncharacterized protein n=1 Tax=Neorhizobium lilium TaxID=2503024 RepID=A0A444LB58_9HYPH|nr:hypothetical protein [Neorhizobium lilium]RWX74883.1 hypothetical protein EPK99_23650 [Neorhizobium lilium]
MHPWEDDRRRFGAIDEQKRINEEMARDDRRSGGSRGGVGYLLFIVAVIFFKPFAEFCVELYNNIAGHVHHIGTLIGL